jgi:Cu-processing system permease protein
VNTAVKVMKYAFFDLLRSRWLIAYTLFFALATSGLLFFGDDPVQAVLSSLNLVLLVIPLVALMLGMNYYYYTRDFVQLILTQPVARPTVYLGQFVGVAAPLAGAFVLGTGVPYLVYSLGNPVQAPMLLNLLVAGAIVSLVFTGLAFWIGIANEERAMALGIALGIWLALSIVYDGLVLFFIVAAQAYPIESAVMALTLLNPIDLSRVLVLLQLDTAALLGYTGALFDRFLGSAGGMALALGALLAWVAVPAALGLRAFKAKDF